MCRSSHLSEIPRRLEKQWPKYPLPQLTSIGAKNIATFSTRELPAAENESNGGHPKWTHLAALQISGDGTDDEIVYVNSSICSSNGPSTVTCDQSCTTVLPPSSLPHASTVSFPPYVTSLEVGWLTTRTGANGSPTTEFTDTTVTTALQIPAVTVNTIDYWIVVVSDPTAPLIICPTSSIVPSPFVITDSLPRGVTGAALLLRRLLMASRSDHLCFDGLIFLQRLFLRLLVKYQVQPQQTSMEHQCPLFLALHGFLIINLCHSNLQSPSRHTNLVQEVDMYKAQSRRDHCFWI